MSLTVKNKVKSITALKNSVIVTDMNFKERITSSGLVLLSDDSTTAGIRPRWAQVYAIGPEQADVKIGDWICVAHGRWSRGVEIEDDNGIKTIRKIDPKDILLISDVFPADDTLSDAVQTSKKER